MWTIKHIFDGEYGCEERMPGEEPKCLVTLEDEEGNERRLMVFDSWLIKNHLDVGSIWDREVFDIVTQEGVPTGGYVEREHAHAEGICHRTAHVWIYRMQDGKVQVLLQKRAMNKDSFPGRFDTSSAGHIPAGSEPLESALRELKEELGIVAKKEQLQYADKFRVQFEKEFHSKLFRDNEVAFVFCYGEPVKEEELVLQTEEVECVEWFDLEEVIEGNRVHDQKFCVPRGGLMIVKEFVEKLQRGV